MNAMRAMKDLALGDVMAVAGSEGNGVVKSSKKIKKGLDAGKLQVTLVKPEGETEVLAFDPEEQVKVVGKQAAGGKGTSGAAKGPTGAKEKKKKTKGKANSETPTAVAPKAETSKSSPRQKEPTGGAKKLSALDAAAKVLAETGTAMNCQELIQVMADKGLWTSPGGKTPAATLYAAIHLEQKKKGAAARFRKTDRGKFEATSSR
jgi:hypothetical protein